MHRLIIGSFSVFVTAAIASGQVMPATHPYSGMKVTAGPGMIERDGPRPAGPAFEARAMKATSADESPGAFADPPGLIKRVKPLFRYSPESLVIPNEWEVIFFADARVVRVHMHLKLAGQSLEKAWLAHLRRYFDYLDRDGDGVLNSYEADFVASNRGMQQLFRAGRWYDPNPTGRRMADFDRDGDGVISFDEFAAYYAPSAGFLLDVRLFSMGNQGNADEALTDGLFKALDRDHDGKLSKQELAEFEKLLPLLDENDDECLSALEIVPNLQSLINQPMKTKSIPQGGQPDESLLIVRPGAIPDVVVESLLKHYDKNKDLRLSKAECGFDDATFQLLDKNGDGQLDIGELLAWKKLPPDLTVEVVLGGAPTESRVRLLPGPDGKPGVLDGAYTVNGNGGLIRVGNQSIDLAAIADKGLPPTPVQFNSDSGMLYNSADPNNRGYFTERDIIGPQFQLHRVLFDVMDRNGDGRVTRQEFNAYFQMQQSFVNLPLRVTYMTKSPNLFALIDADQDGRLCVREMRNAWSRLRVYEPGSGDFITRAALKPQAMIRLVRAAHADQVFVRSNYFPAVQTKNRGPLWFRRMDRNNDGDVSRAEFLGRPEDFDKLDTDHDGLISVEEAEAADKILRTSQAGKTPAKK